MKRLETFGVALTILGALLMWAPAGAQGLVNADFSSGLDGWQIGQHDGGEAPVGDVAPVGGGVVELREGSSFLVTLAQSFQLPPGAKSLAFEVWLEPGFDTAEDFIPDAFEVSLLDADGAALTPGWRLTASAFLNLQEDGTATVAPGGLAALSGSQVTVDVSELPAGTGVTLLFALIGGDDDTGSAVRVGGLVLDANLPPVAVASPSVTTECGQGATVVLDGGQSSDPDGDPLEFEWADEAGEILGTTQTVEVSAAAVGTYSFTLTVRDQDDGMSTDSVTVTVEDTTGPQVDAQPAAATTVGADQACAGSIPDLASQLEASDACGEVTVVQEPPAGTALGPYQLAQPQGVTLTATDEHGNTAAVEVTVTLVDGIAPTLEVPGAAALTADAACQAAVPDLVAGATGSDACPGDVVVEQSPAVGATLSGAGDSTVVLTATDVAGNAISMEVLVTVVDETPPAIDPAAAQVAVSADGQCEGETPDLWSAGAGLTDNCTPVGELVKGQDAALGAGLTLGAPTTVTLTAADAAGNEGSAAVEVSLVDDTPPVVAGAPPPQTLSADAACGAELPDLTGGLEATDNCTAGAELLLAQAPAAASPLGLGETVVALTVTDAAGNSAQASGAAVVVDDTPPAIAAAPEAQTQVADAKCAGTLGEIAVEATDNCTPAADLAVVMDPPAGVALSLSEATDVSVTVTDAAGNSAATEATATLVDESPPELLQIPGDAVVAADAQCAGVVGEFVALAVDNCTPIALLTLAQEPAADVALVVGVETSVTLSAEDAAGNAVSTSFDLTLMDQTAPELLGLPLPAVVEADASCAGEVPSMTGTTVASDNCTAPEALTVVQEPDGAALSEVGVPTLVTLLVYDEAGNHAQGATTATLVDVTSPAIAVGAGLESVEVVADADCQGTVGAASLDASDNCTPKEQLVVAQDPPADGALALDVPKALILTVTDQSGNQATSAATVTLRDETPPEILSTPPAQTIAVDDSCTAPVPELAVEAADNCTAAEDLAMAQDPSAGSRIGQNVTAPVLLTVTDGSGNQAESSSEVTAADTDLLCGDQPGHEDTGGDQPGDASDQPGDEDAGGPAEPDPGPPDDDLGGGTGGSSTGGGTTGGTTGDAPAAAPEGDGGCSCNHGAASGTGPWGRGLMVLLCLLGWVVARRRTGQTREG